jgi:hypothetical protein
MIFHKELKKKNYVNKNQGWEPIHKKYKVNEKTSKMTCSQAPR